MPENLSNQSSQATLTGDGAQAWRVATVDRMEMEDRSKRRDPASSAASTAGQEKDSRDLERGPMAQTPHSSNDDLVANYGPPPLPFSLWRCVALVAVCASGPFLSTFTVQSTVIILPTIGRALNIPDDRLQWVISAYNLTFGCFLLLWGRIADVYGKRAVFLIGAVFFTITSLVTPFIKNEIGFDVFRALSGLAAAAMAPTALGILGVTFPPSKAKDVAFGCFGAGAPLGGVFGNIFGGVIGEYVGWKWVIWIFSCFAAVATVGGYFVIPATPPRPDTHLLVTVDWIGGALVTIGLVMLLFVLTEGNVVGWSTPWVPTLIVVAVLLIIVFGFWQHYLETRTTRPPLLKMSVFHNRKFTAAIIVMALFFASFNNFLVYATYWFQDYQGLSVIQTTLRFIPNGVAGILVALVTGQILSRVEGDLILFFSTICVSLSSLLFAIPIPTSTTYWAYGFPAMILSVCGADTIFPVLTLFTVKTLPPENAALGGGLINAMGQLGRAIGLAIATAVETSIIASKEGVDIKAVGRENLAPGNPSLKSGIRDTAWFNFGLSMATTVIVVVFIRGIGIIGGGPGKVLKPPGPKSGGR